MNKFSHNPEQNLAEFYRTYSAFGVEAPPELVDGVDLSEVSRILSMTADQSGRLAVGSTQLTGINGASSFNDDFQWA